MKRSLKILFVLVLVVGIGFLMLFTSGHGPRDAAEAYKRQLLAQGEKLTLAEVAPPPPTNTPNLATEFTYPAFSGSNPPAMTMVAPGVAAVGHIQKSPDSFSGYDQNVESARKLRAILDRAAVIDFNLDYSLGANLPLPHLAGMKQAGILFSSTAVEALRRQDHAEALADLNAVADLIRLTCNEPIMISGLVRAAVMTEAVKANWEALQDDNWTDSQLGQLQRRWEAVEFSGGQTAIVRMEIADILDCVAKARSDRAWITTHAGFSGPGWAVAAARPPGSSPGTVFDGLKAMAEKFYTGYCYQRWRAAWSYDEELYNMQIGSAALKAALKIQATGIFVPAMTELEQQMTNIDELHANGAGHFVYSYGFGGTYDKCFAKMARAETMRRLLVVAIALKRYQLEHTNDPASLNDLVPRQLERVPIDFMDGKPLRYRLKPDGGFLLYSVGNDGKDDGGDGSPIGTNTLTGWPGNTVDIVWPRAARPGEVFDDKKSSTAKTNAPTK